MRVKLKAFADVPIVGPIIPVLIFIALWQLVYDLNYFGQIPLFLLPSPITILANLVELLITGELEIHIGVTLLRALDGYVIAIATAIPLGLSLGWYRSLYKFFEPIFELFRPLPSIALLAFALLIFGIGSPPIIFIVFYASFFILFIATLYGVYGVDETLVLAMRSMRNTDMSIFLKVVVPSSLPFIFGGLRQALAVSLILVVGGEMVVGNVGLGYFVMNAERTFRIPSMYAALTFLGMLGYSLTKLLLVLENKLLRWRRAQQAMVE